MPQEITTPTTTSTPPISLPTVPTVSWLKAHETIVIVVLVLSAVTFIWQKGANIYADIKKAELTASQNVVAAQKAQVDADLAQAKTLLGVYQQSLAQSQQQNLQLTAQINSRNLALTSQQNNDKVIVQSNPSQFAQRWATLIDNPDVQDTDKGFQVGPTAALATVQSLEQVPVLQADLKDEQAKTANLQSTVDASQKLVDQGKITVDGLQVQIKDQQAECTAQVASVKADARKSKLKWFGIGFVVGFVAGHIY
jgi:hypothetical protein